MPTQKCDFCKDAAVYDGKTLLGPWAFMCEKHFKKYGLPLKGLYTVLAPVATQVCRLCGQAKPITEFYSYTDHSGKQRRRNECKECNLAQKKQNSFRR